MARIAPISGNPHASGRLAATHSVKQLPREVSMRREPRASRVLFPCALLFLLALTLPAAASQTSATQAFNVASYNLRYDTPADGDNAWAQRRSALLALLRRHRFDIIGTQEGLHHQIQDIAALPEYAYVGAGRDDGRQAGEYAAIIYRKDRFKVLRSGIFWLSESPDVPSFGWDARCCRRSVGWAHLKDRRSGRTLYFFSAHFDHQGELARRESAKLMLRKIRDIAGDEPVISAGDLNATPGSEPVAILLGALRDASAVSLSPPTGPNGTFNGFQAHPAAPIRIDYLMVSRHIQVKSFATLDDAERGRVPSDHFPIVARVALH